MQLCQSTRCVRSFVGFTFNVYALKVRAQQILSILYLHKCIYEGIPLLHHYLVIDDEANECLSVIIFKLFLALMLLRCLISIILDVN